MKKTARWLVLLLMVISPSRAIAQELNLGVPPNPRSSALSMYPFYTSLGVGIAPLGNFGTEGNPWLDNGNGILADGYGTSYGPGFSLEFTLGLDLDDHWSIALATEYFIFSTSQLNYNSQELNFIPAVRYTFERSWATPYLTAGVGLNMNNSDTPTGNTTDEGNGNQVSVENIMTVFNIMVSGGAGLLFRSPADSHSDIYVQAQYEEVFTAQGNFSYFPMTLGYRFQGPP